MKKFTHLLRVRYAECDGQQIVFNAKYAEYIDVAATEYTRHIWGSYQQVLEMGVDSQVVNLNISWQASAVFDDVLAISVSTGHIGNSSYTLTFEIYNHETQVLLANAEIVYVMVDTTNYNKMTIPADLKAQLESGADGVCVNHAGA